MPEKKEKKKTIDLINKEFELEKEQLNLDRKLSEYKFKEIEYNRKIREAEYLPDMLREEKQNVLSDFKRSKVDLYQNRVNQLKEEIEGLING